MQWWRKLKPSPVVISVFMAGAIGVWIVIVMTLVYEIALDARDVAVNLVWFMTLAGWWTERMRSGD